jgi:hypothetical protein
MEQQQLYRDWTESSYREVYGSVSFSGIQIIGIISERRSLYETPYSLVCVKVNGTIGGQIKDASFITKKHKNKSVIARAQCPETM